jgi:non-specific serine/threonine protein kinase
MLETIRAYAAERLTTSDDEPAMRARHATHFLAMAEVIAPHLRGPDQFAWFDRLETEHPNLRAALGWFREQGDRESALRLAGALGGFWEARGYVDEGRGILEALLAADDSLDAVPAATLAKGSSWAGTLAWVQSDFDAALAWHRAALAGYEEAGDERGIAFSLNCIGTQEMGKGHLAEAEAILNDAWPATDRSPTIGGSDSS